MNERTVPQERVPKVSIGLPVYNGEKTLSRTIDSLLAQTFVDLELIISDNASTDRTAEICQDYARKDPRVFYTRQSENTGAGANFKYVLDQARGEYFLWTGSDDTFSPDFIELNVEDLEDFPEHVASCCPNGFDDRGLEDQALNLASLDGDMYQRMIKFFDGCWSSNGLFYSLIRTNVLRKCEIIGQSFMAADWAIILFLAGKGVINRTEKGYAIMGANGISRSPDAFKAFRKHPMEMFFPLFTFSRYVAKLIFRLTIKQRFRIYMILVKLNLIAIKSQVRFWLVKREQ